MLIVVPGLKGPPYDKFLHGTEAEIHRQDEQCRVMPQSKEIPFIILWILDDTPPGVRTAYSRTM